MNDASLSIRYALAKQVPSIRESGARICTNYGDIVISAEESRLIANDIERVLRRRLVAAEKKAVQS